jgi:hypothetical protein
MWQFFASATTFNEVRHIGPCPAIEKLKIRRKNFKWRWVYTLGTLQRWESPQNLWKRPAKCNRTIYLSDMLVLP